MEIASSVLSKLGFDWQVALANLVNFLIVYFLLKKVVFNKLRDAILERKAKAQEGFRLREEAALLQKEAQEMKELMKKEVAQERKEMIVQLEKERLLKLDKTNKEVDEITEKAKKDAEKEKEQILKQIEPEVFVLTKNLAQKVLSQYQEKPDAVKIDALVKKAIES